MRLISKDNAPRSAKNWRKWLHKMTRQQQQQLIANLNDEELRLLSEEWAIWARDKQLPPEGEWRIWLLLAGRGFGKTRAGAEWITDLAASHKNLQIALVGATFDDVRHVMVEGASGILKCAPRGCKPRWLPSQYKLIWPTGSVARCFAAESPRQLRGPEFHFGWADEIAKWRYVEAWDNLMMALRCGDSPRVLATTTPRPLGWLAKLAKAADTALVTGRTDENSDNLSAGFMTSMKASYGDSALARQELYGELLAELPGALWSRAQLEGVTLPMPECGAFIRIVIGVDPAIGGANETGIIIAGKIGFGLGYKISGSLKFGIYQVNGEDKVTDTEYNETAASLTYTIAPGLTTNLAYLTADTDTADASTSYLSTTAYIKVSF